MTIDQSIFGTYEGQPVVAYEIKNKNGLSAKLISYGARLTEMHSLDRSGALADIVLGFDDLDSYIATDTYFGATCGRYANRIKQGRFPLDGKPVQVSTNEGANHLHGGVRGFDRQVWHGTPNPVENSVTFVLVCPDGDEGFPGEVVLTSKYQLTDDNRLLVSMRGITSAPTILNMVHHSYWNVSGHASGNVHDQLLELNADFYTPVDADLLTTGEVLAVAGTPFDFRTAKRIGQDINDFENPGAGRLEGDGGGYDHNWILRGHGSSLKPTATIYDEASGRGLALRTSDPGVQFYSGGYLNEKVIGKGGTPYCKDAGFTLETQKFPDSPNFSHFQPSRVDPSDIYENLMEFQFFVR